MAIKFALVKNPLNKGGRLIPKLIKGPTVPAETFLEFVAQKTVFTAAELQTIFLHSQEAMLHVLLEGRSVVTPFGTFTPGPRLKSGGAADSDADELSGDVDNVSLQVHFRSDAQFLRRFNREATLERVRPQQAKRPEISVVKNLDRGEVCCEFEVGQIMGVEGNRLRLDPADPNCGAFLVRVDGSGETRCLVYTRIGVVHLNCRIPRVTEGVYSLEVRTRPHGSSIRTGTFDGPISIVVAQE